MIASSSRSSRQALLVGGAVALLLSLDGQVAAQPGYVPSFQTGPNGWQHRFGGAFPYVSGSASPTMQDPNHLHFNNEMARINNTQSNYRIGDASNPNLKQWAKDAMKKDNDEVLAGKIAYTARSSCHPAGVPGFDLFGFQPIFFFQTAEKITMIYSGDQQVRHVYLNVPHSKTVKPSWYGEYVGRYEGDTLVVDTIGLNTKTVVDNYRTPHSEKLHVVERWKLSDGGKGLEVVFTIDDPETYEKPWSAMQRYRRAEGPMLEQVCAEGNFLLFDYGVPVAGKPDF